MDLENLVDLGSVVDSETKTTRGLEAMDLETKGLETKGLDERLQHRRAMEG